MKLIESLSGGGWLLDGYFSYLIANQEKFPSEVYAFAIDRRNYDLTNHQSLHDAWLEWLVISEPSTGSRSEIRSVEVHCRFLAPFHDNYIELRYFDVSEYSLVASQGSLTGHGDLLMHEVRFEDPHVVHEMLFSTGAVLKISCRSFEHRLLPREVVA